MVELRPWRGCAALLLLEALSRARSSVCTSGQRTQRPLESDQEREMCLEKRLDPPPYEMCHPQEQLVVEHHDPPVDSDRS